jgi:hypothetical protein
MLRRYHDPADSGRSLATRSRYSSSVASPSDLTLHADGLRQLPVGHAVAPTRLHVSEPRPKCHGPWVRNDHAQPQPACAGSLGMLDPCLVQRPGQTAAMFGSGHEQQSQMPHVRCEQLLGEREQSQPTTGLAFEHGPVAAGSLRPVRGWTVGQLSRRGVGRPRVTVGELGIQRVFGEKGLQSRRIREAQCDGDPTGGLDLGRSIQHAGLARVSCDRPNDRGRHDVGRACLP